MSELSQTIQELPLTGVIPVGLSIIIGLLMWAAGRRLLRPGFAAAGLLLGGAIGWIVGSNLNLGVPPWVAALIAGIGLGCIAALGYRLAVGGALGLVLGIAAPLAVLTVHELQDTSPAPQPTITTDDEAGSGMPAPDGEGAEEDADAPPETSYEDEFDRWLNERIREHLPGTLGEHAAPLSSEDLARQFGLGEEVSHHVDHVKSIAQQLIIAIGQAWSETPETLRPMLIAAGVIGALLGMLIGALVPGVSASVVTAFGGGMLWLTGTGVLMERFFDGALMPTTGGAWMVLWVVISAIGLSIQWMFRPKSADKAER